MELVPTHYQTFLKHLRTNFMSTLYYFFSQISCFTVGLSLEPMQWCECPEMFLQYEARYHYRNNTRMSWSQLSPTLTPSPAPTSIQFHQVSTLCGSLPSQKTLTLKHFVILIRLPKKCLCWMIDRPLKAADSATGQRFSSLPQYWVFFEQISIYSIF